MLRRLLLAWSIAPVATHAAQFRAHVFAPLHSNETLSTAGNNASAPMEDREFEYPRDFRLDAPFTISLGPREAVLLPLEPIRRKLFGESDDGDVAIGVELSTCEGQVLSTIAMQDGTSHRFSSAAYQCMTIAKVRRLSQLDLCPVVYGDRDLAIHKDPTQVKGFVLRAFESAEVAAVLRSTKARGAYSQAFFVDADPDEDASSRQLNVSARDAATQIAFHTARVWQPAGHVGDNATCAGCEYVLYAEMVRPLNDSDVIPPRPPPPYCVTRTASISFKLPDVSSSVSQRVTLPSSFGDLFSASGEYSFVLIASMVAVANNGHPAMLSYAPTRVSITASTHTTSRLLGILSVIAIIALVTVVAIKAELPQRILGIQSPREDPSHDDESVRLLAQVIAKQDAEDARDHGEDDGDDDPSTTRDGGDKEPNSESLLDVIRKTKAQETTPQPSPRHTTSSTRLDGYHEIN